MNKSVLKYLILLSVILFGCKERPVLSYDISDYEIPHSDSIDLNMQVDYEDRDALVDAGLYSGHFILGSGISCYGSCHNLARGGNSDEPLPHGGGKFRSIKNSLIEKYQITSVRLPFDKPLKKSPAFANQWADTLVLWAGIRSDTIFETQVMKGRQGHMMPELSLELRHDITAQEIFKKAFGTEGITDRRVACAISAFEKQFTTWKSNAAQGIISDVEGEKMYRLNCKDCHESDELQKSICRPGETVNPPRLETWALSTSDFECSEPLSPDEWAFLSLRLNDVINKHEPIYPELNMDTLSFSDVLSITNMIQDLTDYEMDRYELNQ